MIKFGKTSGSYILDTKKKSLFEAYVLKVLVSLFTVDLSTTIFNVTSITLAFWLKLVQT